MIYDQVTLRYSDMIQAGSKLEAYTDNITKYSRNNVPFVIKPRSKAGISEAIAFARAKSVGLYPISTGKNWGLGSSLPVNEDCAILDLSSLNQIKEVNAERGYAIVEPGVTQGQLSDYLIENHPEWMLHVSGSGRATSVMGNMLDRGVGVYGHRYQDLLGMEVYLGNGEIIQTGFGHYDIEQIGYPQGLGPDIMGLFSQSNLGIVSEIHVKLYKKKARRLLHVQFTDKQFEEVVGVLKSLKEDKVFGRGLLITMMADPRLSSKGYKKERGWFAVGYVSGPEFIQIAAVAEARGRLESLVQNLDVIDTRKSYNNLKPAYLSRIIEMLNGVPTDHALETLAGEHLSTLRQKGHNVDRVEEMPGMVCALPAVPFSPEVMKNIITEIDKLAKEEKINVLHNFVELNEQVLEVFSKVLFNRQDSEEVKRVHRWNQNVHARIRELGLFPYRVNIEQMKDFVDLGKDSFWRTINDIKSRLDPDGVIAPGRYGP